MEKIALVTGSSRGIGRAVERNWGPVSLLVDRKSVV